MFGISHALMHATTDQGASRSSLRKLQRFPSLLSVALQYQLDNSELKPSYLLNTPYDNCQQELGSSNTSFNNYSAHTSTTHTSTPRLSIFLYFMGPHSNYNPRERW